MYALAKRYARVFKYSGALLSGLGVFLFLADRHAEQILLLSLAYPGIDKLGHFLVHGVLVMILHAGARTLMPSQGAYRRMLMVLMLSAALGLFDELHQLLVAGREFDLFDVLANLLGALAGLGIIGVRMNERKRFVPLLVVSLAILFMLVRYDWGSRHFYQAGLVYMKQKNYPAARQAFHSAIDQGETLPALFNELAWLELEYLDVDPGVSLSYTERAVRARPENADFLDTHGWALFRNGRYREALKFLSASYAADRQGYCINYHLGATYYALGARDEARSFLKAQLARSDSDRFADRTRSLLRAIDANG